MYFSSLQSTIDWPGTASPKWPVLWWVKCKTLIQSHNQSNNLFHTSCYLSRWCYSVLQCFDAVGWVAGRISGCKKNEWWGAGMVICLERGANDLHMVRLMPLPLIISCFIKIQNGLPFWCQFTQVILEKRPLNGCSVVVKDGATKMQWCAWGLPSQNQGTDPWDQGACQLIRGENRAKIDASKAWGEATALLPLAEGSCVSQILYYRMTWTMLYHG